MLGLMLALQRIPPAFAHHVKKESSYATLESEAVKNWRVKLAADRDGLLFKNGWKEFFEHHVLRVGDFLLFRYNGNMHFTVQVFGRSCCEDSYVFTDEHEKVPEAFRRPVRLLARKPEGSEVDTCLGVVFLLFVWIISSPPISVLVPSLACAFLM